MMANRHFAFASLFFVALALLFSGCVKAGAKLPYGAPDGGGTAQGQQGGLKTFSSYEEVYEFLKPISGSSYGYGYATRDMMQGVTGSSKIMAPMPATAASESDGTNGAQGASSYSQTNVQVAGVDEPDIVKNDNRYIYVVKNDYQRSGIYGAFSSNGIGTVKIIDAYPAESMKQAGTIELDGTISEIFVYKDKLVVFGSIYVPYFRPAYSVPKSMCMDCAMPQYYSSNFAFMRVYDISDRANPKLVKRIEVKGSFSDARMIDGKVYSVFSDYAAQGYPVPLYRVDGDDKAIAASEIGYFDWPDSSYNFNIFSGVDLNDLSKEASRKVVLMGSSQNLYVSQDNMYVTYTTYDYYDPTWKAYNTVFSPLFDDGTKAKMAQVDARNMSDWRKQKAKADIATAFVSQKLFNPLDGEINSSLREELSQKLSDYMQNSQDAYRSEERTQVHKFALDGSFTYKGEGSVPGHVLNQFSMDEYNGNFRIATTSTQQGAANDRCMGMRCGTTTASSNNMYVLGPSLSQIGKIEGIAQGETIYSVRFMGDRAYMVTFKKIDPFFVVDLSAPSSPKILGQLKIPGYSNYLHPYDTTHVIGLGKDAVDAETANGGNSNFAWYQGVKLSLFDVSDVEHPKEVAKYNIGDRGTDSGALSDHKAFLFSKEKNLLVIPVLLAKIDAAKYPNGVTASAYGDYVFQGAYAFGVTPEGGFVLKGTVSHTDPDALAKSGYYYYGNDQVKRSLYMGNTLYTVSDMYVKANDLGTMGAISTLKIGSDQSSAYPSYAE